MKIFVSRAWCCNWFLWSSVLWWSWCTTDEIP